MFMKSLALAAALTLTPAAAGLFGSNDVAHAQAQGGGGQGGGGGSSGGNGSVEGFTGMTILAKVPNSQSRRPNDPPTIARRSGPGNNQCVLQNQPNHRMECAPY